MGWSTTVVAPPDGSMAAYIDSLRKVAGRADATYWPTHGPSIPNPQRYVEALVAHRLERERQIIAAVGDGVDEVPTVVARLYADVARELHTAAGRTVLAHLQKLVIDGAVRVVGGGPPRLGSRYELT
jgi:glyoxylase-like metal-dependent hydrolase (beta-lactamase superfamily II)